MFDNLCGPSRHLWKAPGDLGDAGLARRGGPL